MKDRLRNLFSIRKERKPPPVGSRPPIGAVLIHGDITMAVDRVVTAELWDWLVLSGWRTVPVKEDRRRSRVMPEGALAQLLAASALEREQLHTKLLQKSA